MAKILTVTESGNGSTIIFGGKSAEAYRTSLNNFMEVMSELEALPPGIPIPRTLMERLESPGYRILVENNDHTKTA